MNLNKKAILELAKSFGRFIYFGLLGLVATFLTSLLASGDLNNAVITIGGQTLNVGFIVAAGVALAVKAIDRYRHVDPQTDSNGLAPKFLQK